MSSGRWISPEKMSVSDLCSVQSEGLLLPIAESHHPILVAKLGERKFGVILDGSVNFLSFEISIRSNQSGIFFEKPEIVFDLDSLVKTSDIDAGIGNLGLYESKAHVIAMNRMSGFADGVRIPLWASPQRHGGFTDVMFSDWGLGYREGERFQFLWRRAL